VFLHCIWMEFDFTLFFFVEIEFLMGIFSCEWFIQTRRHDIWCLLKRIATSCSHDTKIRRKKCGCCFEYFPIDIALISWASIDLLFVSFFPATSQFTLLDLFAEIVKLDSWDFLVEFDKSKVFKVFISFLMFSSQNVALNSFKETNSLNSWFFLEFFIRKYNLTNFVYKTL